MSGCIILAKKIGPILFFSVATSCVFWRRYRAGNKTNSYKVPLFCGRNHCVNDASKENYSRSDAKDLLSELPFEVLSQILSHISIRDVARMATLSRHWRNVCLALPRLDLDWHVLTGTCKSEYRTFPTSCFRPYAEAYVKRVDQVLAMYRDQNIISFQLSCCLINKIYGGDIDRWMNFVAASKSLQSLTLQFACGFSYRDPDELHIISGSFLSQFSHLKCLHLNGCILRLEKEFKFSNNLTTLDLNSVLLGESQWQDVFSCSSTIKCLWLRRCKLPSKLCFGNNFPHLSFLLITECIALHELEVCASKLQRFDLHTHEDLKCSFFNVPNLERVYLYVQTVSCVGGNLNNLAAKVLGSCAEDILNNLAAKVPSLKYLSVRGVYSLMHKLPTSTANLFYSVSSLRISMIYDDDNMLTALPLLLISFPQLKNLEMKLPNDSSYKRDELPALHAHSKLKYIEIFDLQVDFIPIAIYLLKSALVLSRMVVTKASKGLKNSENLHWFYKNNLYSDEERLFIHKSLIGKASSTNAELIIK